MHTHSNELWQSFSPSSLITPEVERYYAQELVNFYRERLIATPRAYKYVTRLLGLHDENVLDGFRIGFCDRKYTISLPPSGTPKGDRARGYYERLAIINGETGHEAYRGMVFVPLFDNNGELMGGYGQRVAQFPLAQRGHVLWGLRHGIEGYFFNQSILSSFQHIVLCASPFDVLSFCHAGINNALSLLDFTYFDDAHLCRLLDHDVSEATIAFPRTGQGDRYFAHMRRKLEDVDIKVNKLELVVGESVNSLWAQSQRFSFVLNELSGYQTCQKPYH